MMKKTNASKMALEVKIIGGIALVAAISALVVLMVILMTGNSDSNEESPTENNQTSTGEYSEDNLANVIKNLPKYEALEFICIHLNGYWSTTSNMFFGFIDGGDEQIIEYGIFQSGYGVRGKILSATATGEYSMKITIHIPGTPENEINGATEERDEVIYLDISDLKQNSKIKIKIGDENDSSWKPYSFGGHSLEEADGNR